MTLHDSALEVGRTLHRYHRMTVGSKKDYDKKEITLASGDVMSWDDYDNEIKSLMNAYHKQADIQRELRNVYQRGETHAQPLTAEQMSEPITSFDTSSIYEEVIQ